MIPRIDLTQPELALFDSFARAAGAMSSFGGSPLICRAASLVSNAVIGVDGSRERLDAIAAECRSHADWIQPHLVHADIGVVTSAGHPTDTTTQDRWPEYHQRLWAAPGSEQSDLFLLGGRFRVACGMQTLLRCRADTVILFQTYRRRREYHGFAAFAREIAAADDLVAFVPRPDRDPERIRQVLERFRLVTS